MKTIENVIIMRNDKIPYNGRIVNCPAINKFRATTYDTERFFKTLAGAKRFMENKGYRLINN